MLFLHTIGQTWQNTIGLKTLALIVNKSVASSLLGVARLYLIIIAITLLKFHGLEKNLNSAPKVPCTPLGPITFTDLYK